MALDHGGACDCGIEDSVDVAVEAIAGGMDVCVDAAAAEGAEAGGVAVETPAIRVLAM